MAEISPVHVIRGCTLILYFFLRLGLACRVVLTFGLRRAVGRLAFGCLILDILRNLQPVLWNAQLPDMRLVAHPCSPAATEKPVLDRVLHGRPKVGIVLNLKVQCALNQLAGHAANRIIVTKPALRDRFGQLGIDRGNQRLDVAPQDVEFSGFVRVLAAVVVAVAFNNLRTARFPLFEFVVVLADDVQPLVDAGARWFHYLFLSLIATALFLASALLLAPHARNASAKRVGSPSGSTIGPGIPPMRARKLARRGLSPALTGALSVPPVSAL